MFVFSLPTRFRIYFIFRKKLFNIEDELNPIDVDY